MFPAMVEARKYSHGIDVMPKYTSGDLCWWCMITQYRPLIVPAAGADIHALRAASSAGRALSG